MAILVTGGAGFIGNCLCEHLIINGEEVIAVDDLSLGAIRNVDRLLDNPLFSFYEINVNSKKFKDLCAGAQIDTIFHLAANSNIGLSHKDPNIDIVNTFNTTFSVLEVMRKNNISELVFASTSAIYGDTNGVSAAEDHGPLVPHSHYGAAKMASEGFIYSYCENYDITAWITRFPNVVGDFATHGVVYDFVKKLSLDPNELEILGDGEQTKPYIFVTDLVDAMMFVWKNSADRINVFNIGNHTTTNVRRIAEITSSVMKLNPIFKFKGGKKGWIGDVPNFTYNFEKLRSAGWEPKITSDEAISRTAAWLKENLS